LSYISQNTENGNILTKLDSQLLGKVFNKA